MIGEWDVVTGAFRFSGRYLAGRLLAAGGSSRWRGGRRGPAGKTDSPPAVAFRSPGRAAGRPPRCPHPVLYLLDSFPALL